MGNTDLMELYNGGEIIDGMVFINGRECTEIDPDFDWEEYINSRILLNFFQVPVEEQDKLTLDDVVAKVVLTADGVHYDKIDSIVLALCKENIDLVGGVWMSVKDFHVNVPFMIDTDMWFLCKNSIGEEYLLDRDILSVGSNNLITALARRILNEKDVNRSNNNVK